MYNIDFLSQLEKFKRYIFGNRDSREINPNSYFPCTEVIECKEDINEEWVPDPVSESKTPEQKTDQ